MDSFYRATGGYGASNPGLFSQVNPDALFERVNQERYVQDRTELQPISINERTSQSLEYPVAPYNLNRSGLDLNQGIVKLPVPGYVIN